MSGDTDDEFDFTEFTEDELKAIDSTAEAAFTASGIVWPRSYPGSVLTVNTNKPTPKEDPSDCRSRKSSGFSVFDLTEDELRSIDESVTHIELSDRIEATGRNGPELAPATTPKHLAIQHVEISIDSPLPSTLVASPAPTLGRSLSPASTAAMSLYAQFRSSRKAFSVSDLVGPAWCEVQFDYGLRGGRNLPVSQRPTVLKTRAGRSIPVRQDVAIKNDVVMKGGTAVHKKLEREIRPTEITVTTRTREDGWGLRMLNMLSNIRILIDEGRCREMPVMGFTNGHFVSGVIDEIVRTPIPPLSPISPSIPGKFPTPRGPSAPIPSYNIQILDNKTRGVPSKPKPRDTLQSRLQLMLYKRLLDALLETPASFSSTPQMPQSRFSFSDIWKHHSLDPSIPFSSQFLEESSMLILGNDLGAGAGQAECLQDLEIVWREMVEELVGGGGTGGEVDAVCKTLKLVYRLREGASDFKKRSAVSGTSSSSVSVPIKSKMLAHKGKEKQESKKLRVDLEDVDLQRAIQASLKPDSTNMDKELQETTADLMREERKDQREGVERVSEDLVRAPGGWVSVDDDLQRAIRDSLKTYKAEIGRTEFPPLIPTPPLVSDHRRRRENDQNIIGTYEFEHDNVLLDEHLCDVLDFWHDRRPPRGVAIEDTGRCSYCEFADGCEWLDAKAAEITTGSFSQKSERKM